MNRDSFSMAQGEPVRAYAGAANAPYVTSGYAQVEAVAEPSTIVSYGYEVGRAASRAAVLNVELAQLLDSLRGTRPTPPESATKNPSPGAVMGLFELNIADLHNCLNNLEQKIGELKRTIGNL